MNRPEEMLNQAQQSNIHALIDYRTSQESGNLIDNGNGAHVDPSLFN